MSNKITFKIVLASDPNGAYKTISILEEAPFTAVLRYAAEQFGENASTCGITTAGGVGINPDQSCGNIFLKHGGELKLIPKDKVGAERQHA